MPGRSGKEALEPKLRALIGILLVGLVAVLLDTTIVNVATARLAKDLHTGVSMVQWVSTGFLLALGVSIPLSAWAVGRFGGRSVWLAGVALFTVGSVLAGVSWNIGSLIAFRVVQGLGGGLMLPVQQTLLVRAAGPARLGRVMAAISLPAVVVPILGPVAGGLILQAASWRWIFLINVPIGLVAFVLAWRGLDRDQDRQRRPLDVTGLVLFVPGVVAVLYALTRVAQFGVREGAWVPLALGVLLLAGFAVYAARVGDAAMIDVRLFRVPSFAASSVLLFLSGLSLYGVAFLLPLFYQQVSGYSALTAGLLLAPQGIGSLAARRAVGKLSDRYGARPVVLAGLACALVGSLPFGWVGVHGGQVPQIAGLVVRGAGLSAVNIAVMVAAYQGLSKDRIPHASSTTRILLQVGGSFGVAVAAVVLQHELAGHPGGPAAHASGFGVAFLWMTALTVIAVPPALILPRRRRPEPASPVTPAGSEARS
ncbi:MDR family MFS transporter [Streptomyces sp. NPDC056161]|uniref:MDR family MFS transporter n=1 Tax=Streptomyces sp. NPDC056161 TaxID=3345732 RepID=UPI0035DAAEF6